MTWLSLRRLWVVCAAMLCFAACSVTPARAQLVITLDTARMEYLVDERFYVTLTLANVGVRAAPFLRLLDPVAGIVTFEILPPNGKPFVYEQGGVVLGPGAIEDSVMWLGPGAGYSSSADISDWARLVPGKPSGMYLADGEIKLLPGPDELRPAMLLSTPGEYSIRACYAIPPNWPLEEVTLWSNEVHVSVVQPVGDDLAAHEILRAGPRTEDQGIWNAFRDQTETYQRVLRDYPESVYATYCRWSLGSIRGLDGMHFLRGTPEAPGLLEEAADLFLSVAREAGQTPFGLRATEAAAKDLAKLGRSAEAQALLEDAFVWPSTTDDDRARLLAWMKHIETGYFWRSGGLAGEEPTAQLSVPLREFAEALRFSANWDARTSTVTVSSRRMKASLHPGESDIIVNGLRRVDVRTCLKDDRTLVSPSVIATLMAAHYGKGMENAFPPQMIAQAQTATTGPGQR